MRLKRDVEKSIIKTYRKKIWSKFVKAIKEYKLISEGDKIAVCVSGGKDSLLLAKCLEELEKHGQFKFSLEYILMDPGYNKENLELIKNNCQQLGIKLNIFKSEIFDVINQDDNESPCYVCARMRRGHLYNKARELGCNKIALGHHFNDVIETILLNVLYAGQYKTMMPKLKSDHYEGMELIRPLYYVKEEDIISWQKYNDIKCLDCGCKITIRKDGGKRKELKALIKDLKKINPDVDISILRSSENVNIDQVISHQKDKKTLHFLDNYSSKK
ncbi:MAG: ATP-binding protein [Bacilli bacterium]|nr:ATP-binding protein [Bacilli bacterium]